MIKKIVNNFYVYFFIVFIFSVLIFSTISKDKIFSDYENKKLQKLPSLNLEDILNTKFQEDFENYVNDQIVFRNLFIRIKNYFEIVQLKLSVNDIYLGKDNFYIERFPENEFDVSLINSNITYINEFKQKYSAEVYLIPTASEILRDKLYITNDIDFNKYLKNIENNSLVNDILNNYEGNKSDLYYKTDHHWTTIGAYELYKNIVNNPVNLNLEKISDSFYGTINNRLNITMKADDIYKQKSNTNFEVLYDLNKENKGLYFDKYLKTKDKYSYFLDGNHGLINIENKDINNNEKLLIIKDSYANCFIPFIIENYKKVDVIDLRYFNVSLSEYIEKEKYDRIIVLYSKSGFMKEKNVMKLKN